jgi:hypothetical protein
MQDRTADVLGAGAAGLAAAKEAGVIGTLEWRQHCDSRCATQGIHAIIIDMTRPERAAQTVDLALHPIPDELWPQLDAVGNTRGR